eukprot:403377038
MIQGFNNLYQISHSYDEVHQGKSQLKSNENSYISSQNECDTEAETHYIQQQTQNCFICQGDSEYQEIASECQFCGLKICSLCFQDLNPKDRKYDAYHGWSFKLQICELIPNIQAREYFLRTDELQTGFLQKESQKTFKCLICKETNIPFFEFKEHFEEICPEIVVTCQGCKIHECARSKLRFHINDCEYSEHQCNKCDQNYILKDLKTHDCFSMLEHKFNQVLKENLNLEAIIGDLKAKDQKQRATFKELVINIKYNNKQIEQLNRDLSGEAQLETQAFGSKFCKKCQNGVGHLTCALCKDYMCFGCQQEPINKSLCYKEQINGDQFNYYFSINLFLNTKISLSSQPFLIKLLQKNQIQSYILAPTKW